MRGRRVARPKRRPHGEGARRYLIAAGVLAADAARAQPAPSFPVRPLRLVLGFPPGSAADVAARLVAAPMAASLG